MQSLKIVPRLLPEIQSGLKTHTIRWREKKIVPGPMLSVNDSDISDKILVFVTKVEKMPLSAVAFYLGKQNEWTDDGLLLGMREHYPEIEMDSVVDIIHHITSGS